MIACSLGAATAAFGAGLSRSALATYLPAFFCRRRAMYRRCADTLIISRHPETGDGAKMAETKCVDTCYSSV